ncbi:anti-sigma factor [Chamaesiphon sp. VAR_69_metabat_338]|uniref:anti-sigma factor n=1 Tax=Chamaesiphon sp. VAR_69_metabat_338 TaxID=2964704 RepID=UPI00286D6D52|nr:anti-sigma factor [Chamaesiphon sp. VAR_69_metabat_338]
MSDNSLPPTSTSESWSELLAGYVLGDLTPAEIDRVEAYLRDHPECQAEIESLMLPLDLLPLTLPAARPPASLRSQILQVAAAETAPDFSEIVPVSQLRRKSMPLWKPIAMGLELLAIGCLGWYSYHLSQELATVKQDLQTAQIAKRSPASNNDRSIVSLLQQPNNRFIPLKNMPQQTGAGNLIVVPNKSVAVLVLQQIKPLPPGQVYRTWAIMGDEEMSCADFLPDKNGKVFIKIPLDRLKKATKVMVTIEQKEAKAAAGEIAIEGEI